MPYKAWSLPISCLTIHRGHRCQVLVCMSLRPKEDMLIPEIREHVSLTNGCGVSHRHDQPSPPIKVFLLNVFVLHWSRIKFRDRMQFSSLIYFQTCCCEKSPKWMKKRLLCVGMWDASDTELTSNCSTPTEAQHDRLGLLLTGTRGNLCGQHFKGMTKSASCLWSLCFSLWLTNRVDSSIMDLPPPMSRLDIDVDLGFALFFLVLLCVFLLVTMVRCAQMVLDPYSSISASTYQEEMEEEGWRFNQWMH